MPGRSRKKYVQRITHKEADVLRKTRFWYLTILVLAQVFVSCSANHPATDVKAKVTQYTDVSYITGIVKHDGYIYCSTHGGLLRWNLATQEYAVITTAEGLVSNVLTGIVVDGDSILWVSSREGIASFDGKSWRQYGLGQGLPSPVVTGLTVDGNGKVWAATQAGAAYNEGRGFRVLEENGGPGRKPISCVFFDKGNNLWITTENDGLYYKLQGNWLHHSGISGNVSQSWDLNIWVCNDIDASFWTGIAFTKFPTMDYLNTVGARCIKASEDRIWFFTEYGVHSSHGNIEWRKYTESEGLVSNDATAGLVVSDNEIYVGTANGLSVIRNDKIENYIVPNTPVGYDFISVGVDSKNRVWLGSWETGVSTFENGIWAMMDGNETVNQNLYTVQSIVNGPSGETAFNTLNGILLCSTTGWNMQNRSSGIPSNDIRCGVYDHEGRYWAGTSAGICYLENGKWNRFREYQGLPSEDVWACAMDEGGTVWFGTTRGIVSFNNTEMKDRTAETGLDSIDVRAMYANGRNVYFGSSNGRLVIYNGKTWDVNGAKSVTSRAIDAITTEPSGAVWIGTDGDGIFRLENGKVEHYTVEEGIPFNVVRSLAWKNGTLWMACYGGAASLERIAGTK